MPPDTNTPHPEKPGITPRGAFFILAGFLLIGVMAVLSLPMVLRSRKNPAFVVAITNARMIGMALAEFDTEYGRFPDAQTAVDVASRTRSNIAPPGTTANDHLRQLLAAGIINSEQIFYAKTAFTRQPDNIFDSPKTALPPGELGFGYILNGDIALGTTDSNPAIPVLCTPLAFDGRTVSTTRFDPSQFDGRAVFLKIDMSAVSYHIDKATGEVLIDGKSLLRNGEGTIWGSAITPHVATPVPK